MRQFISLLELSLPIGEPLEFFVVVSELLVLAARSLALALSVGQKGNLLAAVHICFGRVVVQAFVEGAVFFFQAENIGQD